MVLKDYLLIQILFWLSIPNNAFIPGVRQYMVSRLFSVRQRTFLSTAPKRFSFFLPRLKDYDAVFFFLHQFFCIKDKFFQLNFWYFAFKNGALNPVQVLSAKFKHFSHTFCIYIIYQYYIHYQYILKGLYVSMPSKCFCNL